MKRDNKKNGLNRVYTTKSESRFSLYELKSMVQQSDIGNFWRSPVQKFEQGGRSPFNKAWHFFKLTVDVSKNMGIIISVDSLKRNNILWHIK